MSGRLRRRGACGDRGTTLTELNVTMIVMAVVVAAAASLIIGFSRSNAMNVARQEQIDTARFAVESVSKALRTAVKPAQVSPNCASCTEDAFLRGGNYSVAFYANLNNSGGSVGPSRVTYTVPTTGSNAGKLIETIQRPDTNVPTAGGYQYCNATAAGAPQACRDRYTWRILAEGVLMDGAPLFRYYTRSSSTPLTVPAGTELTGAQLSQVIAIEIHINVQEPAATRADPTTYVQRVALPNVQALLRPQEETTP